MLMHLGETESKRVGEPKVEKISKVPYRKKESERKKKERRREQLKFVVMCWSRPSPDKTDTSLLMQHNCHHCSVADHVLLKKRCVNNLKKVKLSKG